MRLSRVAAAEFEARFGRPARWIALAPGRVNLIGEHTDYNQGWVLPVAIDRWTAVAAAPANRRAESRLWARELQEQVTCTIAESRAPRPGSCANYVVGVADQVAALGHDVPELDSAIVSDVPIGAGLASSAALEVAVATMLSAALGADLDALQMAQLCQRAEHAFAGTPCGIMDMLVATSAVSGHALLIDCRSNQARPVRLPAGVTILVAATGVRHELATSAYAERRRACERAATKLGVASLRDADGLGTASLDEEEERLVRHVAQENRRTLEMAAALESGDVEAAGALMFEGHASLRDLYQVSCPELDTLVETAQERRGPGGVVGARMTGGGFGGCAVALVRPEAVGAVAAHLTDSFAERWSRTPTVFTTAAVGPARAIL